TCSRSAAWITVSPARSRALLKRAPRGDDSDWAPATAASPGVLIRAGERLGLRRVGEVDAQTLLVALLAQRIVQLLRDPHAEQQQIGGGRVRLDVMIDASTGIGELAMLHL